jgi:hypothetical protein
VDAVAHSREPFPLDFALDDAASARIETDSACELDPFGNHAYTRGGIQASPWQDAGGDQASVTAGCRKRRFWPQRQKGRAHSPTLYRDCVSRWRSSTVAGGLMREIMVSEKVAFHQRQHRVAYEYACLVEW